MGQDPIPDVHLSFISINMFLVELEKVKNITETAKLTDFFFAQKSQYTSTQHPATLAIAQFFTCDFLLTYK